MKAKQSFTYPVRSYHTDASGRLFIHQLFNFLQDAAHQHADGLGFGHKQLVGQDLFWVLSRLTVEVERLPAQGDEVQLTTWVKSVRGSISEREFRLTLNSKLLVNASSLWFCLSGETHRPIRLPAEYLALMVPNDSYATSDGAGKIEALSDDSTRATGFEVTARYSDTDMVNHVNNAVYIKWALDSFDTSYFIANKLTSLTVNYLSETFEGNKLRVSGSQLEDNGYTHELISEGSGEVICRVKTSWLAIP